MKGSLIVILAFTATLSMVLTTSAPDSIADKVMQHFPPGSFEDPIAVRKFIQHAHDQIVYNNLFNQTEKKLLSAGTGNPLLCLGCKAFFYGLSFLDLTKMENVLAEIANAVCIYGHMYVPEVCKGAVGAMVPHIV